MKLVGVIIAFQPNINKLQKNIETLVSDVDKLLIYKNSEFYIDDLIINKYQEKIEFIGDSKNIGIASALNEGVIWARRNSFTHILTLDQDSFFEQSHLNKFKYLIKSSRLSNIGIFCPNIDNRGSVLLDSKNKYEYVADSITSGSIFPLATFDLCGLFEDSLFIDAVDYEFCYRIFSTKNLQTIIFPEIILKHEVGNNTKIIFGLHTDNYSAFRTYFIIKNHIIIWKRYPKLFQRQYKITLIKIHIIYRLIKIIIGENDKYNKLKSIFTGIFHGLFMKLGKK